jgi:hypothetical protein
MAIRRFLWGAALAASLPVTLVAQQAPAGFHQTYCVKVNPGKDAAFTAMINGDLRKLAQYDLNAGTLSAWMVLDAIVPQGNEARCDTAVVYFYPGMPPAPMSDPDWAAELQKAIGKTPQEFTQELEDNGTLVESSIVRTAVQVGAAKEGDYLVVNEMTVPDTSAWIDHQKKMWQPIFEDGLKDGAVDGWAVVASFMPRGAKDRGVTYTVDIYPNWQSAFTFFGSGFPDRWKKIHPDVPVGEGMTEEQKFDTIEHTILYKVDTLVQSSK